MSEHRVPFLCGGVLLLLLFEACYEDHSAREHQAGIKDDHSATTVVTDFVSIVHHCSVPVSSTAASEFRSCKKNGNTDIPFNKPSTIRAFNMSMERNYRDTVVQVCDFTSKHINPSKKDWLATALIDVIESDSEISESDEFAILENGSYVTKSKIRMMTEFALEPLVLGILHYILNNRSEMNTLGQSTLNAWSTAGRGKERKYTRTTAFDIDREITAYFFRPEPIGTAIKEESTENDNMIPNSANAQYELVRAIGHEESGPSDEEPYNNRFHDARRRDYSTDSRVSANGVRNTNVSITGDNGIYVEQNNGIINMVSTRITTQPTGADLLAIRNFSQEYYQLIVTGDEILEESSLIIPAERALIKGTVPDEIYENCSSLSPAGQEMLKKIPAIICNENTDYHGKTDPEQSAIYARIEKIKVGSGGIKLYYKPLDLFPQRILNENSIDFGIRCDSAITELNRCAWSVKKVNLFEAFEDVGLDNIRSPK